MSPVFQCFLHLWIGFCQILMFAVSFGSLCPKIFSRVVPPRGPSVSRFIVLRRRTLHTSQPSWGTSSSDELTFSISSSDLFSANFTLLWKRFLLAVMLSLLCLCKLVGRSSRSADFFCCLPSMTPSNLSLDSTNRSRVLDVCPLIMVGFSQWSSSWLWLLESSSLSVSCRSLWAICLWSRPYRPILPMQAVPAPPSSPVCASEGLGLEQQGSSSSLALLKSNTPAGLNPAPADPPALSLAASADWRSWGESRRSVSFMLEMVCLMIICI